MLNSSEEFASKFAEQLSRAVQGRVNLSRKENEDKLQEIQKNFWKCVFDDFLINQTIPCEADVFYLKIVSVWARDEGLSVELESTYSRKSFSEQISLLIRDYMLTNSPTSSNHGHIAHDQRHISDADIMLDTHFCFGNEDNEYFIPFTDLFGDGEFTVALPEQ